MYNYVDENGVEYIGELVNSRVSAAEKKVNALYKLGEGITHSFETDTTAAYSKPVPVGARLAGVKKIGGMTLKQNDSLIASPVTALHSTIDGTTVERTQIPDEIIALEGYGDGINDTCCNYVDFEAKTYHKYVDAVDLGALNWNKYAVQGSDHTFKAPLTDLSSDINNNNGICIKYDVGGNVGITDGSNKGIWLRNNTKEIYLSDSTYTDVEAFKAAVSGVTLYYGLEAPVNTDISDMLTTDFNILDVMPNGQLTFENENKIAVPNEVEYVVSLAEVLNDE